MIVEVFFVLAQEKFKVLVIHFVINGELLIMKSNNGE